MPCKKRGVSSISEKCYQEKREKSNISLSRTTVYTQKTKFCKKSLFEYKNHFAVKKKTKNCSGAISKLIRKFLLSP